MFEEVFSQILRETQVMALRHKGENEAKELIKNAKDNFSFVFYLRIPCIWC